MSYPLSQPNINKRDHSIRIGYITPNKRTPLIPHWGSDPPIGKTDQNSPGFISYVKVHVKITYFCFIVAT